MPDIEKVPVVSSNIEAIGYDKETKTLRMWLKGGTFDYEKVPEYIFDDLKNATSVGRYFFSIVKDKYSFKKVS